MEARIIRTHVSEKLLSFNDGKIIFNVEEWKPLYYIIFSAITFHQGNIQEKLQV